MVPFKIDWQKLLNDPTVKQVLVIRLNGEVMVHNDVVNKIVNELVFEISSLGR